MASYPVCDLSEQDDFDWLSTESIERIRRAVFPPESHLNITTQFLMGDDMIRINAADVSGPKTAASVIRLYMSVRKSSMIVVVSFSGSAMNDMVREFTRLDISTLVANAHAEITTFPSVYAYPAAETPNVWEADASGQ